VRGFGMVNSSSTKSEVSTKPVQLHNVVTLASYVGVVIDRSLRSTASALSSRSTLASFGNILTTRLRRRTSA
jgi:hypothetical protein